jgi:hypothetical protein
MAKKDKPFKIHRPGRRKSTEDTVKEAQEEYKGGKKGKDFPGNPGRIPGAPAAPDGN